MIPVVTSPRGMMLHRPVAEPLWDTEYMARGSSRPLEFFRHCAFEAFGAPEAARERLGPDRSWKTQSDTNVMRKDGCPLLSHNRYDLRRVVLYPSTDGVAPEGLAEYRAAVERLRQSATLEVHFGPHVHAVFPLRDAMPNVDRADGSEGFDPSDAPDLTYRVGVDLELHLAVPGDARGHQKDYPLCILTKEEFYIRVVPHGGGESVGIRCYLVGTHLKAIQG